VWAQFDQLISGCGNHGLVAVSHHMSESSKESNEQQGVQSFRFRVSPSPKALAEAEQLLTSARKNTVSKEAAIKFLASTGMYTPTGELIPVEER
jgi:hypothetical protein